MHIEFAHHENKRCADRRSNDHDLFEFAPSYRGDQLSLSMELAQRTRVGIMHEFGCRDGRQRRRCLDPPGIQRNRGRTIVIMLTAQEFVQKFAAERHPRVEDEHATGDLGLETSGHGPP